MKALSLSVALFVFMLLLSSCITNAQEQDLDANLNTLISSKQVAGAAVAVSKNGEWLFHKNYGHADIENNAAVTDSTGFNIMSVTKNFIACAVVQLAVKREIALDDPITKYLAGLPAVYNKVLIRQLLSHTAGVPDYVHIKGYMQQANRSQTAVEVLQPVINAPLEYTPGQQAGYSNSGYFLLGLLIEKVSGSKLAAYLKNNIFNPLHMNNTYLDDNSGSHSPKAKGYTSRNNSLQPVIPLNPSQYWAAGGIVSTITDMMKWDNALKKGALLPLSDIAKMMQPAQLADGRAADYGLGFELMNMPGMKIAGNNGVGVGFNAANLQFLNDQLTVIVLTNTTNANSTMIAKNVRDIIIKSRPASQPHEAYDKLDSLAINVVTGAVNSKVNEGYFFDAAALAQFNGGPVEFIQRQGKLVGLSRQGEKINPEAIVRRYQLNFEKGSTNWVIIFSKDGKIRLANHM